MIKRFVGLNIAVKDFDEAVKKYSAVFGKEPQFSKKGDFAFEGLKGAQMKLDDGTQINIITSTVPGNAVTSFLERREGVFLLSLESTDIEADMKEMESKGFKLFLDKPMEFAYGKAAWFHPKSTNGVQWELIQYTKPLPK